MLVGNILLFLKNYLLVLLAVLLALLFCHINLCWTGTGSSYFSKVIIIKVIEGMKLFSHQFVALCRSSEDCFIIWIIWFFRCL